MHFIALQTRIGDDPAQHPRDEQALLIVSDPRVHLLVIQIQTREAKTEEHNHCTRGVDLADDGAKVALGRSDVDAAKKIITAESDNNDARIVRQNVSIDPIESHVRRVAADPGIDHRRSDELRQL